MGGRRGDRERLREKPSEKTYLAKSKRKAWGAGRKKEREREEDDNLERGVI